VIRTALIDRLEKGLVALAPAPSAGRRPQFRKVTGDSLTDLLKRGVDMSGHQEMFLERGCAMAAKPPSMTKAGAGGRQLRGRHPAHR